jgi:hypothetical protein
VEGGYARPTLPHRALDPRLCRTRAGVEGRSALVTFPGLARDAVDVSEDPDIGRDERRDVHPVGRSFAQSAFPAVARAVGGIARAALVVGGFGLAAWCLWIWAFVEQQRELDDLAFLVWGILVVALGVTSGVVFVYGLINCASIDAVQRVDWHPLRVRAAGAAAVASALTCFNLVIDPSTGTVRGVALTVLAIIGGMPAATAMLGIRAAIALSGSVTTGTTRRLQGYLELRSLASQLLTALGSLVALTTFALGASIVAHGTWQGLQTAQVILVFGAFGTTLVGLGYQVPRVGLRHEARLLLHELAPLNGPDAAQLRQELEQREKVERYLGLHTGLLTELQAGIVILSPLLAAATALLIPGG